MKLSEIAWAKASPIYQEILEHPFNRGLRDGTLSQEIFNYYIEQDSSYLKDFARALAMLAARCQSLSLIETFLKFSQEALVAEQTLVHQFFREKGGYKETNQITRANLAYTSYLLQLSALEPVEVGVAAVLPCFWIYREVGLSITNNSVANNPYERWISTYSGEEFSRSVDDAIHIFDSLAEEASEAIRQRMCDAFYKSSVLEWHFWEDAYHMKAFDDLTSSKEMAIR